MQRALVAASRQAGLRRLAPPRPLGALLAVVLVVGLAWALVVAPWQSPDETTHFAYAQGLAENFQLPGVPGRPGMSSDQSFADGSVGASRGAFYAQSAPPDWSRSDYRAYLAREHGAHPPPKTDGSGVIAAETNPPLYYLIAAGAYLIDGGGTAFGRLYAIRIFGVVLLCLTTVGVWLLAGETFGRRRFPQLTAAAAAGLLPMNTFMSTAVNPDALLITTWTYALWLGARVINHRLRTWDAVALCAVTAAAILTKATSYALVVPVLFALFAGWRRRPADERGTALRPLAAAGVVLAAPVAGWVALTRVLGRSAVNTIGSAPGHSFSVRQFLSYVWQFYLPRLPFLTPFRTTPQLPVYNVWLEQLTGIFGWLDVFLPHWMYPAGAFATAALAAAAVVVLALRLRRPRSLLLFGYFALTLLALLVLLHVTEYRAVIGGSGTFLQGRYLLPVVGLFGLAVGLVADAVPPRVQPAAGTVVVTGLLVFQAVALTAVLQAYYL